MDVVSRNLKAGVFKLELYKIRVYTCKVLSEATPGTVVLSPSYRALPVLVTQLILSNQSFQITIQSKQRERRLKLSNWRRYLRIIPGVIVYVALSPSISEAQQPEQAFQSMLTDVENDPSYAAGAVQFREPEFRQQGPSLDQQRGNANLPRRWSSDKAISNRAISLITAFEVTNKATYVRLYSHSTWPQGASGVTVGIGYDLGYPTAEDIETDWVQLLGDSATKKLQSVQGIVGYPAKAAAEQIHDVEISWDNAIANFAAILKLYAGETIRYFPNSEELSPDSFGALVSLVYNRGSSTGAIPGDTLDRRREMREIKQLCLSRKFNLIPEQIRKMERLWQNNSAASGLIRRRDLEALLFEAGLK
jgi:GH24 family phage-related lysozyme (muramidase)